MSIEPDLTCRHFFIPLSRPASLHIQTTINIDSSLFPLCSCCTRDFLNQASSTQDSPNILPPIQLQYPEGLDMLDLNVEVVHSPSYCNIDDRSSLMIIDEEEDPPKLLEEDGDEEEEERELSAATSDSSSVVNDDYPPPSAGDVNSSGPLIFGILKKEDPGPEIVTRQLFPTAGEASQLSFGMPSFESRPQWLNLSFAGGKAAGPPAATELRVLQQQQQQVKKSRRGPRSRSSQYRGVTFYRRTGRWESHIWDCGKQVYLGGFDTAYAAARAYDRAAIKFRGVDADINFTIGDYDEDMKQMGNLSKEEFVHVLRRQSTGASRGNSKFRGVAALRKGGRWEPQMGQFIGNKAVIQFNGTEAVTHLEARPYEQGTILGVGTEGRVGDHNLDLNLGISSGGSSKEARSDSHLRLCYSGAKMPPRQQQLLPLGYGSYAAPNHHPPNWSPMYPYLLPSSEGRGIMERRVAMATEGSLKSGWKMQSSNNNGGTISSSSSTPLPVSLMFSNAVAASSGFSPSSSSSSTTPPPTTRTLHHNLSIQNPKPGNPNSFPPLFRN